MTEETKFCKDCLHFKEGEYVNWCYHPVLGPDLVTSKPRSQVANVMRLTHQPCSKDAKLFEEKPVDIITKSNFIDKIKSHDIIAYMFNSKE